MKKLLTVLFAGAFLLTLGACAKKTEPSEPAETEQTEEKTEETAEETPAADQNSQEVIGLPNPVTELSSLEELNEACGTNLQHPPVMGVSDEVFSSIDCGDYKIAEYRFNVAGIDYTLRNTASTTEDISGFWVDGKTIFDGVEDDGTIAYADTETGKAARWFTTEGQFVMSAEGDINQDVFETVTEEIRDINMVQKES